MSEVVQLRQPISQKTEAIRALNQIEDLCIRVYEQQPVGADWRTALVMMCGLLADVKNYIVIHTEGKDES